MRHGGFKESFPLTESRTEFIPKRGIYAPSRLIRLGRGYSGAYSVEKSENPTCDDSKCLSNLEGTGGVYISWEAQARIPTLCTATIVRHYYHNHKECRN